MALLILGIAFLVSPKNAAAQVNCVQAELANLGYQPGPVDGMLGRLTKAAAQAFEDRAGLDLPELTDATAAQWCDQIRNYTQGPVADVLSSRAAQLLPLDVLLDFQGLDIERRAELCLAQSSVRNIAGYEPTRRIEGFTSRMRSGNVPDSDWVPGARDAEDFASYFGNLAVRSLATNENELRGQLLDELERWARAGAFLDTHTCNTPGSNCTEWTVADGSDPSRLKDWEFAMDHAAGIIRSYYIALADFQPVERVEQHAIIADWIAGIGRMLKPAEDVPNVFFYGQVFWPAIVNDYAAGRDEEARAKLLRLARALDSVALASDGSIPKATTRGDRALWYHFYSLSFIVPTMEMMRAANIEISPRSEERLHRAVSLFLAALDNPSTLHPWARAQRNSTYSGTQDFNFGGWTTYRSSGTWLHIYPYRYPDREEARQLRTRVSLTAPTASQDSFFGPGIGCLYNAAAEYRDGPSNDRMIGSGVEFGGGTQIESTAVVEVDFAWVREKYTETGFVEYVVNTAGVHIDGEPTTVPNFSIYTDFFGSRNTLENLSLFRLVLPQYRLQDEQSMQADFLVCDDVSARRSDFDGEVYIRFLVGSEPELNECVLEKLGPNDRDKWSAVVNNLSEILAAADGDAAARAAEVHAYAAN